MRSDSQVVESDQNYGGVNVEIDELLKLMVDKEASDLHLKVPSPTVLRIDGALIPQENLSSAIPEDIGMVLEHVTTQS